MLQVRLTWFNDEEAHLRRSRSIVNRNSSKNRASETIPNRATRCAGMGGALGVPWRTCHTDTTSSYTARAARRVRATACRQVAPADPEGWHHSRTTQRWRTTLWSHM